MIYTPPHIFFLNALLEQAAAHTKKRRKGSYNNSSSGCPRFPSISICQRAEGGLQQGSIPRTENPRNKVEIEIVYLVIERREGWVVSIIKLITHEFKYICTHTCRCCCYLLLLLYW